MRSIIRYKNNLIDPSEVAFACIDVDFYDDLKLKIVFKNGSMHSIGFGNDTREAERLLDILFEAMSSGN